MKSFREINKIEIHRMFDRISSNYDFFNRLITLGIDIKWRKRLVHILRDEKPKKILDIGTGTADLAIELIKTRANEIIGIDTSKGMLNIAKKKIKKK